MPVYDASNAQCHIFTYKEGVLSAIAHDLKIAVSRFTLTLTEDQSSVSGEFDASSLKVVCAMQGTNEVHSSLSASDKRKIEGNITRDVLHTRRFPMVRFQSTDIRHGVSGPVVGGTLDLHGRVRSVEVFGRLKGDSLEMTASLNQPDFGIKPYRAMMGTLRVQARLKVHLSVPRL
jgi:polyisoprenoid-binding protein YceI